MTEDTHNELIYNTGMRWLENGFCHFPKMIDRWQRSKTFWSWWTLQWNQRNFELLHKLGFDIDDHGKITPGHREIFIHEFNLIHSTIMKKYPAKPLADKIRKEALNHR